MKAQKYLMLFLLLIFTHMNCKKENNITLPVVRTYSPLYISSTSATVGLTVDSDGGSDIVCGIYMGTSQNPETTGTQFQIANDTGLFLGQVSGLLPEEQYFIKAYAKNVKGESLGEEISFITPGTITDYENNIYETVNIGNQSWMARNMRTQSYTNGDLIATTDSYDLDISDEISPKYQWSYDGDDENVQIYGRLYTWYTVTDPRKICPQGWHIPSDAEWTTLESSLGGYAVAGSRLKEAGNDHWLSPYNKDATNESCFSALPGGYRDSNGSYFLIRNQSDIWSSTESEMAKSWARSLDTSSPVVSRMSLAKSTGASVRCVKDN